MKLVDAIVTALKNCETWMGGAVVVKEEDGYNAIPGALLTDASYTDSRDVALRIEALEDAAPGAATLKDVGNLKNHAKWIVEQGWVEA